MKRTSQATASGPTSTENKEDWTTGIRLSTGLTDKDHSANICSIAQGLLASGDFTEIVADSKEPWTKNWDVGEDWKKEGFPHRLDSYVAEVAVYTYKEILHEWRVEFGSDKAD